MIKPGFRFRSSGVVMEAVEPADNGDWWCKNPKEDVGLWRYSGKTIEANLVPCLTKAQAEALAKFRRPKA